jgi:hypothetical protein
VLRQLGTGATAGELREFCRARLASFKAPQLVGLADALPRDPPGEVLASIGRRMISGPSWLSWRRTSRPVTPGAAVSRGTALDRIALDPELQAMLSKWEADGGDANFIRLFGRLPDTLKRFVSFYSPLVRKGLVEHRTKELVRLRLAQLNRCQY